MNKLYEIYVNKDRQLTPMYYLGIVKILNEDNDQLINQWCNKKIGDKYVILNKKLIEYWRYIIINDIDENDNIITTLQRKNKNVNKKQIEK